MDGRKIGDRIASCCTKKDWRLLRLICQAQGKIPASARSHVPNELFLRPLIISKRGAMSTASALRSWVVASVVTGAAKIAHVEAKRLKGAVNWGAGVHQTFQEEWLRPALTLTASQYLMGPASLLDARSYIFGVKTLEEVLKIAPALSLVTQGLIDQPCAPLLCINGKDDDQHPISDLYLLAEHGSPKDLRIIEGAGHMGRKPGQANDEVQQIVTRWLKEKLL